MNDVRVEFVVPSTYADRFGLKTGSVSRELGAAPYSGELRRASDYIHGQESGVADQDPADETWQGTSRGSLAWTERVVFTIKNMLPGAMPNLENVAAHLLMTPRTLQNKLKAESQQFQRLLDQVLSEFSIACLRAREYSITELAFMLGYADQASFTRAFKRWTGMTPAQYRREMFAPSQSRCW